MTVITPGRVYSKQMLLRCRALVPAEAAAPWQTLRSRGDGLKEVRLASADGRFEICDLTRMWEAVAPLIVRESEDITSPELLRLGVSEVFEATGLSKRVVIDGHGEIVRIQILLPKHEDRTRDVDGNHDRPFMRPDGRLSNGRQPAVGWITATSTPCGAEGRIYISAPSTEAIHSAGYPAFLLSHGRKFLLMDDADVYPSAEATVPSARLHWGWHVQQYGIPQVSADECEIRLCIQYPVRGWLVAKRLHGVRESHELYISRGPFSATTFVRPYAREHEDMATGTAGCTATALMTMQLRAEVETSAPVVGHDLYEQRSVQLAGPCVLTDFVAGNAVSVFIRAPVTDARANLLTPRWATVGSVAPDGAIRYFMHVVGGKVARRFKWNVNAFEFTPASWGYRVKTWNHGGSGRGGFGPAGTEGISSSFNFPKIDGSPASYRVAVRVRGFAESGGEARKTAYAFRVGQELTQKSAVFWREETRHVQTEHGELIETVAVQWMQVVEGNTWVPLMEISLFSGKYLKFLKRGDVLAVGNGSTKTQVVSIAEALADDFEV